jgi:pseudouridine-5'-phosphate glycosidase
LISVAVSEEVKEARAVVALESTILAHGLPWPANLEVGRELEAAVRAAGAVPATIAVIDGEPRIGLDDEELERVARGGFVKAGASDLGVVAARRGNAATTVSATIALANRAGINVMATGGIGGVHRGDAMDVSSDLTTLAALPIAVVSAGAKAILDLARTVELLETLGVLTIGAGTDELPAFYSRRSGVKLEHRSDSVLDLAAICAARWSLGQGGVLIANPIPVEHEIDVEPAIREALAEADARGVRGKAVTPFLLAELERRTGGKSVAANRALALENAKVGGALAVALAAVYD